MRNRGFPRGVILLCNCHQLRIGLKAERNQGLLLSQFVESRGDETAIELFRHSVIAFFDATVPCMRSTYENSIVGPRPGIIQTFTFKYPNGT